MDLPGNPGMTVVPTGASLGADVIGVELSRRIDSLTFKAIEDAWHQHLVLRFRGQQLDDPGLLRFARLFGELRALADTAERAHVPPGGIKIKVR